MMDSGKAPLTDRLTRFRASWPPNGELEMRSRTLTTHARLVALAVLGALALSGVAAGSAAADVTAPQTVFLDSWEKPSDGQAGPVSTSDALTAGRYYGVEVSGTFSPFIARLWTPNPKTNMGLCGTKESVPMFPSPGRPTSAVGVDPEI